MSTWWLRLWVLLLPTSMLWPLNTLYGSQFMLTLRSPWPTSLSILQATIQGYCSIKAPHNTVLIQYRRFVNSLQHVGLATHFDTTVQPVLGGHLTMYGVLSRDDRADVQKRVKCTRKLSTLHEKLSTLHEKLSAMSMEHRGKMSTKRKFECMCTSMKVLRKMTTRWRK